MKKNIPLILLVILIFSSIKSYSQLQDKYWIFGSPKLGYVPVNMAIKDPVTNLSIPSPVSIPLFPTSSSTTTGAVGEDLDQFGYEGSVVATDPITGELLFYTDGQSLWDGNHILQTSALGGNPSSTQPAAVCVEPICPFNSFYVFSNPSGSSTGPITYRKYDKITGNFTTPNLLPYPATILNKTVREGMIIIPSSGSNLEFFLISRLANPYNNGSIQNTFTVHKIDAFGISYVGQQDLWPAAGADSFGNLTYTTDRSTFLSNEAEIAITTSNHMTTDKVYTFGFNTLTGALGSTYNVITQNDHGDVIYDLEYSPNGDYLYYSTYDDNIYLSQYSFITHTNVHNLVSVGRGGGGLKKASDGNIYHITKSSWSGDVEIGRIITPNSLMPSVPLPTTFYEYNIFSMQNIAGTINFPEFVTIPAWEADITIVDDPIFCEGDPVLLSASFTGNGVSPVLYNWYLGSISPGNLLNSSISPTFTVTQNGTYYVEIVLDNGCSVIDDITIDGEPCCFAAIDAQYVHITDPISYTSDVVWDNKYYVNTIITVDGAVLDITNVDVVFGECAGINFINGGYLRSNNSVFRPCNVDGSWRGLVFDGTQTVNTFDNIINESTFKNAEVALYFKNGADGVISNNLFSNCNNGVRVDDNNQFEHPISGNNFVIENFYPVFNNCYGFTDNNTVYGIYTSKSKLLEISQNNFINSIQVYLPSVFGIHQEQSGAKVSENIFTNINTSVTVNNPWFPEHIENNEIEINRNISNNSSISVFNSDGVIIEINNNKLINNYHSNTFNNNGIYVDNSSQVSILNNQINGFDIGVYMANSGSTQVSDNLLTRINNIGIYYNTSRWNYSLDYITCNDITMSTYNNTKGIQADNTTSGLQIVSNCIKDSEQSIRVIGNGLIPNIKNNYLYNYRLYGLYNDNHTGNIGSFGDPGTNTFWSNNNSAVDIYSNNLIQVADNFGVFNITFSTVQITSNNPFHSTASCGQQIFNMPSQGNLNTSLLCDNIDNLLAPLSLSGNVFSLKNTFEQTLHNQKNQFTKANMILSALNTPSLGLLNNIITATNLSDNEVLLLKYMFYYREGDILQAKHFLNLYSPINDVEAEYKTLSLIDIDVVENNYQLTTADVQLLKNIVIQEKEGLSNYAVYLLKETSTHPNYVYKRYINTNSSEELEAKKIKDESDFLSIFPNPAKNSVLIELISNQEENTLQMFDVTGKNVTEYKLNISAGRIEIDIQNLKEGVYFITLTNPKTGLLQKGKIIKINN